MHAPRETPYTLTDLERGMAIRGIAELRRRQATYRAHLTQPESAALTRAERKLRDERREIYGEQDG